MPDTPEAQSRLRAALESIMRGTDTSGVVLELRRKDDGKPYGFSGGQGRPPGGLYTHHVHRCNRSRAHGAGACAPRSSNAYLLEEIEEAHNFEEIVGRSRVLAEVIEKVKLVAGTVPLF